MMVDIESLAAALRRAFSDLESIEPLRLLGEGFGSLVVETPDEVVFRIARHARAGAQYAREAQVLPILQGTLPVTVPLPRWYLPASVDFPFGVIGYRKLPGEPLDPSRLSKISAQSIARQIGELINALQRIPLQRIPLRDLPLSDAFAGRHAEWLRQRSLSLPVLRERLQPKEYRQVAGWWQNFLAKQRSTAYQPVLQHGDLWFGNLLVQGQRITGLLDWQEVALGDPAQDFVPQLYLGERFYRWVLNSFQRAGGVLDEGFHKRLPDLWAVREFSGLSLSIEQQDHAEVAESIEKIRRGPILSPLGLDGWPPAIQFAAEDGEKPGNG